jgi:hypothetical protein
VDAITEHLPQNQYRNGGAVASVGLALAAELPKEGSYALAAVQEDAHPSVELASIRSLFLFMGGVGKAWYT